MKCVGEMESQRLQDIYERLDELDASTAEMKAARILHGLGTTVNLILLMVLSVACRKCG